MKLHINFKKTLLFAVFFISGQALARDAWDWKNIDTSKVVFNISDKFLFGVANAELQVSGTDNLPDSNWKPWEEKPGTIDDNQKSGVACDFWNRYKSDITLIKGLGCNAFRLSIDWSAIEPRKGLVDVRAVQHYHDVIDSMLEKGITPMVTLHHFVHPQWFEELGAFEKEENILYFVKFCAFVFEKFGSKIHLWCPINEPCPYVLQGYITGAFPPGQMVSFTKAGVVLKNLLIAHTLVYRTLKAMPHGKEAQIGFIHQYLNFEGYNPWDKPIADVFRHVMNTAVLEFIKTGRYIFSVPYVPFTSKILYQDKNFKNSMDFIGLNYYSEVIIRNFQPGCYDHEVMTDMPYASYPEGFYAAIKDVSQFGKPIYITENGIGDARDDRRELYIKRYLYAMKKAMVDFNADIRGYFYWTLMDNIEWEHGTNQKFGLYQTDFVTQQRTLREGAKCIKQFFKPLTA